MKKLVDFRLILLLIIAAAFLHSSLQPVNMETQTFSSQNKVNFDYDRVFNVTTLPIFEEYCLEEPSPPYPLPAL